MSNSMKKSISGAIASSGLRFERFSLAGPQGPLRFDGLVVRLQKKPLCMLWELASRSGEVVTKDELLTSIWKRTVVTEGVISACLKEIRRALGDDARQPRFIATAHGIGYRFIADVQGLGAAVPIAALSGANTMAALVGRGRELGELQSAYARALSGQRQLVFVSGEAGIGKSSLVRQFLSTLPAQPPKIGHGQCIETYGSGEPFLPILEAITRLCKQPGGQWIQALLTRYAPTWIGQLPGLFASGTRPGEAAVGGTLQRMLREMAEVVDRACAEQPLILVLEDLHWSDASSVDWLMMLASRREPARILVLVTSRDIDLVASAHPLARAKRDLVTRSLAQEIPLAALAAEHVADYVAQRMPQIPPTAALAQAVFRRSQGHPLFMVHLTDDLMASAADAAPPDLTTVPARIADLIEAQVMRLAPEQLRALEAASVAGAEFAAATVSAALDLPHQTIESILETFARGRHFIEARGMVEWRDGTLSANYGFVHDLYRDVLSRRLTQARRMRLHAAIGARLALAYGPDSDAIASELAEHFEAARERQSAAWHRSIAGKKALQRHAAREALLHASRGLSLLAELRDDPGGPLALELLLIQGAALLSLRGFGAPEVEATYTQALALGLRLDAGQALGPILSGLYNLYFTRAAFTQVDEICHQIFRLLAQRQDTVLEMLGHNVRGTAKLYRNAAAEALPHVRHTLALYEAPLHGSLFSAYGEDLALTAHHYAALAYWVTASPALAAQHLAAGHALARDLQHPFGKAQMLWMEALLALDGAELACCERLTAQLIELCREHDFPMWLAGGQVLRGAALAGLDRGEEGQLLTAQGLRGWRASGTDVILPYYLAVTARVQARTARPEQILGLLDEAIAQAERTGECWYQPELHRQRAELMVMAAAQQALQTVDGPATAQFEHAIALAQAQGARLFEARSRTSLADWHLQRQRAALARPHIARARSLCSDMLQSREWLLLEELCQRTGV